MSILLLVLLVAVVQSHEILASSIPCQIVLPQPSLGIWFDAVANSSLCYNLTVPQNGTSIRFRLLGPYTGVSGESIGFTIMNPGLFNNLFGIQSAGNSIVSTGDTDPYKVPQGIYNLLITASNAPSINFSMSIEMLNTNLPIDHTCNKYSTTHCQSSTSNIDTSAAVLMLYNNDTSNPLNLFFFFTNTTDSDLYQPNPSLVPLSIYLSFGSCPNPQSLKYDATFNMNRNQMVISINESTTPSLMNGAYCMLVAQEYADTSCDTIRYFYAGFCQGYGCTVDAPSGYITTTTTTTTEVSTSGASSLIPSTSSMMTSLLLTTTTTTTATTTMAMSTNISNADNNSMAYWKNALLVFCCIFALLHVY